MTKIGIIIGSTRPGRKGQAVGQWVYEQSKSRSDAEYELIDLVDYDLPLLDEAEPAASGNYSKEHTKKWASKIEDFDGFIMITPEYNHGTSPALLNALDFLYKEWTNKAVGFVGYGWSGGQRGIEHLRLTVANLEMASVRAALDLNFMTDFKDFSIPAPGEHKIKALTGVFDQVEAWAKALKPLRG